MVPKNFKYYDVSYDCNCTYTMIFYLNIIISFFLKIYRKRIYFTFNIMHINFAILSIINLSIIVHWLTVRLLFRNDPVIYYHYYKVVKQFL